MSPPSSITPAAFLPAKGERALSIGQTGSGKTTFNVKLLSWLPFVHKEHASPVVIYDTKHDDKFLALPNSRVSYTLGDAHDSVYDLGIDHIILRPHPAISANPRALDAMLAHHEEHWRGVDAYIDELFSFHRHGQAGPGLNGLYTRGRSRGITTIGSTQRPAWVSGFIFSETNKFYCFRCTRNSDRKRIGDFIENYETLPPPPRHAYHFYEQGSDVLPALLPPVPVDAMGALGYTDDGTKSDAPGNASPPQVRVWL